MPGPRPTIVTVFATLNIVFGSLGLLCGLCVGLGLAFLGATLAQAPPPPAGDPDPFAWLKFIDQADPTIKYVLMGMGGFQLAVSLGGVIGGIGMLGLRSWARPFVITVALVSILGTIASQAYSLLVLNPALQAAVPQMVGPNAPPPPPENMAVQLVQTAFGTIIALAYPVTLLFVMFSPTVTAAFRPQRQVDPYDSYGGMR